MEYTCCNHSLELFWLDGFTEGHVIGFYEKKSELFSNVQFI